MRKVLRPLFFSCSCNREKLFSGKKGQEKILRAFFSRENWEKFPSLPRFEKKRESARMKHGTQGESIFKTRVVFFSRRKNYRTSWTWAKKKQAGDKDAKISRDSHPEGCEFFPALGERVCVFAVEKRGAFTSSRVQRARNYLRLGKSKPIRSFEHFFVSLRLLPLHRAKSTRRAFSRFFTFRVTHARKTGRNFWPPTFSRNARPSVRGKFFREGRRT